MKTLCFSRVFFLLSMMLITNFYCLYSYSTSVATLNTEKSKTSENLSSGHQVHNAALNSNKNTNAFSNSNKLAANAGNSIGFTSKEKLKTNGKAKSKITNLNKLSGSLKLNLSGKIKTKPLPDDFISWFEGWVHYHKYNNDTNITRPRDFFVNSKYFNQRIPVKQLNSQDKFGKKMIPDKNAFYIVLGKDTFNIYYSRDNAFLNQVDSLSYEFIEPIPTDKKYEGGVVDLFKFSIGHCLLVKAKLVLEASSEATPQRWVFCVDREPEKDKLLNALITAKLYNQDLKGQIVTSDSLSSGKANENVNDFLNTKRREQKDADLSKGATAVDGYWVVLQDWTDCNLKCGGGLQFKQRMCVPPKAGGRECVGEAVETKECNTQPCPEVKAYMKEEEESKPIISNPIVKIGSFSNRPQRYIKCVIKDVDAFADDSIGGNVQRFPVRVVMNEKTLAIYKSDDYQDVMGSFDLADAQFTVPKNSFCCFIISDKFKSKNVCGYEKDCGTPDTNEWVSKWDKDFNEFKNSCYNGLEASLLSNDDTKLLSKKAQNKVNQANLQITQAKQVRAKEEMVTEETQALRETVVKTQQTGFEAIEKELDIENLLKEEEKMKESDGIKGLQEKLEAETEKLKCVQESIKEKEIDTEFVAEQHQADNDIKEIKQEIADKITKKREKLKNLLDKMRKKSSMEKAKLEGDIKTLRFKISQDLMIAQRNGSIDTCHEGKLDLDKREAYCNKNFVDDFINNADCKKDDEFCYLCCETEFGNTYMDKREQCYSMCDVKEEPKKEAPTNRWLWKAS